MNLDAFALGRRAAAEPERVAALMSELEAPTPSRHLSETLDEAIARRVAFLTAYQNRAYAERYRIAVERVADRRGACGRQRDRAHRRGRAQPLQAHGLQGRIRGGAALHGRPVRQAGRGGLRGRQPALRVPPGAAAPRSPRPCDGRAAQDEFRAVDAESLRRAGAVEGPARHPARPLRLYRRAPHRAPAGPRLRGAARARSSPT